MIATRCVVCVNTSTRRTIKSRRYTDFKEMFYLLRDNCKKIGKTTTVFVIPIATFSMQHIPTPEISNDSNYKDFIWSKSFGYLNYTTEKNRLCAYTLQGL